MNLKMGKILCMSFFLLLVFLLTEGQTYTSVINTESGPVRGLFLTTIENVNYAAFKGIPYANAPIGNLRFKPPVPVDSWTNIYNASTEGSVCPQIDSTTLSVTGSEDCLYINVFTPHTEFNESVSKPVMVWIYGGSFMTGHSNQSLYGPDFILKEDVILVSFNYRVSALGFLNLGHENATGNCGLKDQSLALRWVKTNIAQFGGNPDKVTIFGQSAGSVSVDLQVLSDMSSGLFNQSISMSGSTLCFSWGFQRRDEALRNGFILGSILGINTTSTDVLLETLHKASAADIVVAANYMYWLPFTVFIDIPTAGKDFGYLPFRPSLENPNIARDQEKFLTECTLKKYAAGNYTKGPHMMGFTSNETLLFARNLIAANLTKSDIHEIVKNTTDFIYIVGIDTKQKLMSLNNNFPIYYYRFSFSSNYSVHQAIGIDFEGAAHVDDVPYILYMPSVQLRLDQPDIAKTRQRMVKLYTNFAKYGNPTPNGENDEILGITWPDSRSNGEHLDISAKLTTGPRPIDDAVKNLQSSGLGASPVINDCIKY